MQQIKSVCVYCGSSTASDPKFDAPARELGQALAKAGIKVVYGGGSPGLMGKVADAAMEAGGHVVGIIPDHILRLEVKHSNLSEMHVVPSMHVRKQMMTERADAFVVLPGGIGTLDETFEIITWKYLGLHDKPVLIANIDNYWAPFQGMMDHMKQYGFVRDAHCSTYVMVDTIEEVMNMLLSAETTEARVRTEKI
jgi:uncharacterized protein (TIGR00730 family)